MQKTHLDFVWTNANSTGSASWLKELHFQQGITCNSAIFRRPHRLPSTLMFDHPTTKAIAAFAAEQLASVVSDAWMRWPWTWPALKLCYLCWVATNHWNNMKRHETTSIKHLKKANEQLYFANLAFTSQQNLHTANIYIWPWINTYINTTFLGGWTSMN